MANEQQHDRTIELKDDETETKATKRPWTNRLLGLFTQPKPLRRCVPVGDEAKRERMLGLLDLDEDTVETRFHSNFVRTTHYRWWYFLPLNLFHQFRRAVNTYFLVTLVICFSIPLAPVDPLTWFYGLLIIVVITMAKQGFDDYNRYLKDRDVNTKTVQVVRGGQIESIESMYIEVGDIVVLTSNDTVPCDLVVLSSSNKAGHVFIETSNLDGETNLKTRRAAGVTIDGFKTAEALADLDAFVECESPNPNLRTFVGKLVRVSVGRRECEKCVLDEDNLLLSGTQVKNTARAFGACVYTGGETKLALNSKIRAHKFSRVEKSLNTFLFVYLFIMAVEIIFSTASSIMMRVDYLRGSDSDSHWYFFNDLKPRNIYSADIKAVVYELLIWLLLYNYVIPISLYCSVEFQKFGSSFLFGWDAKLYDEATDTPAKCSNSDVPEDLGLVTHVFSDKTGTLTMNRMALKVYFVAGRERKVTALKREPWDEPFVKGLVLCHSVQVQEDGSLVADSPDEEALVQAAAENGFELVDSTDEQVVLEHKSELLGFDRLQTLPFDSFRKCMSVIVRCRETGRITLYCKGAETALLNKAESSRHKEAISEAIDRFSRKGYRTLAFGYRHLTEEEYGTVEEALSRAKEAMTQKEETVRGAYDSIETGLELVGATGIEDKLQEDVYETVVALRAAGIKFWMLTGDKKETAMATAKAAGLVGERYGVVDLTKKDCGHVEQTLERFVEGKERDDVEQHVLVVDGNAVAHLLSFSQGRKILFAASELCHTVVASRLSPIQKSQVIRLIKDSGDPESITLAVGDGGNDVSMIQEAHVGVGVRGREGSAAVRAADFSIARFKFLRRTLLVHGHWNYHRLAYLVQYSFYKNVTVFTCQLFHAFFSNFSATNVYDTLFLVLFNLTYTSLPILMYGLTEQNYGEGVLMTRPELYRLNSGNRALSFRRLLVWIINGVYQSVVVYFGTYWMWPSLDAQTLDRPAFGFSLAGTIMVVLTFKLLLDSKFWNVLLLGSIAFSMTFFISVTYLHSEVKTGGDYLFKSYGRLLGSLDVWLLTPVLAVAALLPEMALVAYENVPGVKGCFAFRYRLDNEVVL